MSYVLSHRATIPGGLAFGLVFAFIHALSGALGVFGLHYIIARSVSETLESVTSITQIVSFGLITFLGLVILCQHVFTLLTKKAHDKETGTGKTNRNGMFAWALSVGLVPCRQVVMVMLFCMSMDVTILGWLLAGCISMGMATTISFVVVTVVMGKTGMLSIASKKTAIKVESILGMLSGAAIAVFGLIFLLSNIQSVVK